MSNIFDFSLFINSFPQLISRLHITLLIVVISIFFGFIIGAFLALVRIYKIPILSQLAVGYISLIRGIPILVLMFIVYIGLPILVAQFGVNINRWDTLIFVLISYSLDVSAFLSEIIRASITGVEKGQTEAAYSVGMNRLQTFTHIVGPQAIKIAIPSFGNTIVSLLKDTSLAYTLGVIDVVGMIKTIATRTNRSLEAYAASAIIFFILSFALERGFKAIEQSFGAKSTVPGQTFSTNRATTLKGR